ncbi:MAG: hypothetical protein ACHQ52_15240, partial [Candidatus Eisenbacteria bacterium]
EFAGVEPDLARRCVSGAAGSWPGLHAMKIAWRIAALLVPAVCLSMTACDAFTPPGADLDGRWNWEFNQNPSGSSTSFSLTTAGGVVSGAGVSYGIGPARIADSISIVGRRAHLSGTVTFALTLNFASGSVAMYSGELVNGNELRGVWNTTGNTVVFYRE